MVNASKRSTKQSTSQEFLINIQHHYLNILIHKMFFKVNFKHLEKMFFSLCSNSENVSRESIYYMNQRIEMLDFFLSPFSVIFLTTWLLFNERN